MIIFIRIRSLYFLFCYFWHYIRNLMVWFLVLMIFFFSKFDRLNLLLLFDFCLFYFNCAMIVFYLHCWNAQVFNFIELFISTFSNHYIFLVTLYVIISLEEIDWQNICIVNFKELFSCSFNKSKCTWRFNFRNFRSRLIIFIIKIK